MKDIKILAIFGIALLSLILSSCGGGGGESPTGGGGNGSVDLTAPSGYLLETLDPIAQTNVSSYRFSVSNVELGASYFYSIYDSTSTNARISSSGRALSSTIDISNLNLSSLSEGEVRVEFYLVDTNGNEGTIVSSLTTKDTVVPSGYTFSSNAVEINSFNVSIFSFSVINAEIGTSYVYQIFDSTSATDPVLSDTAEVLSESFDVNGIELIDLVDGAVRIDFYLQDAAGAGEVQFINLTKNTSALADPVTISGTISYDFIPHNINAHGLDYDNIQSRPARGVDVAVLSNNGVQLASTTTSEAGGYSFVVEANVSVRIQATARMAQSGIPRWEVSVTDNTNENASYVLTGQSVSSGATNSIRNLHAPSGWGSDAYTETRASAPFAILDTIYETIQKFIEVDELIVFPELQVRWSVNNSLESGELEDGDIGTSFYSNGQIYILGKADLDTDEYDSHVVVHEWGHYFEDRLSRSDSIGGSHSSGDRLDLRVAFGEGWGNALSGMVLDDPLYRDSGGIEQASGFSIDVDRNINVNEGWYSEGSIQSILYDLYDSEDDGADRLSFGLSPIYDVLVSDNYIENIFFTSIFSFLDELRSQQAGQTTAIDSLSIAQSVNSVEASGSGETNDGGLDQVLPVYKTVAPNSGVIELCSDDTNGTHNKLGVRDFAHLSITNTDNYTITASKKGVSADADPDFIIWSSGVFISFSGSPVNNQETWSGTLFPNDYIIEFYDSKIVDDAADDNQSACYDFQVTS